MGSVAEKLELIVCNKTHERAILLRPLIGEYVFGTVQSGKESEMTCCFVYLFSYVGMQCLFKIGNTKNIKKRINQLSSSSGVPTRFECHFAVEVENCEEVEGKLHKGLDDVRFDNRREFFRIAPERVKFLLQLTEHQVYKPNAVDDAGVPDAAILKKLNLKAAGLSKGDILTFSNDLKKISVVVEKNSSVLFKGVEMSLAKATERAFHQVGEKWRVGAAAEYWFFDEEILSEKILKSDPSGTQRSFSFVDTFPIISRLIITLNRQTKQFASHTQIVSAMLNDSKSIKILEISLQLTRFETINEIAANQVAWWSQQITQKTNPFQDNFERRKFKNRPYEYWALELGSPPWLR